VGEEVYGLEGYGYKAQKDEMTREHASEKKETYAEFLYQNLMTGSLLKEHSVRVKIVTSN
jgi:hypothetical protein